MIRFDKHIKLENLNQDEILFDIETTGINRFKDYVFLIGYIDGKNKIFTQIFSEDGNDEDVIREFVEISREKKLVTYNGRSFDLPFIKNRAEALGIKGWTYDRDYDLYYDIRVNKRFLGVKRHKLTYLENFYGINRSEDIDSADIVEEYRRFLSGTTDYKKLLIHNKEDVLNTEKLLFLRDEIRELKSIDFNFLGNNYKAYIDRIEFDKDFLFIDLSRREFEEKIEVNNIIESSSNYYNPELGGNKNPLKSHQIREVNYSDKFHILRANKDSIKLRFRVLDLKKSSLDIWVYMSTIGPIVDKSYLKLERNLIALMIDNVFQVENIKNLILLFLKQVEDKI